MDVEFYDLNHFSLYSFFRAVRKADVIHLNASSPHFRLFAVVVCMALKKPCINVVHGNLGRFGRTKNFSDYLSVSLSSIPVVLNRDSFSVAIQKNVNARMSPSFLPPDKGEPTSSATAARIEKFCSEFSYIGITNASSLSFDKIGDEIYGISWLMSFYRKNAGHGLIVLDPSGTYADYYRDIGFEVPSNVLIISRELVCFSSLASKHGDYVIRATSTDGDSISVREALYFGVPVVASNTVSRPDGVILYDYGSEASFQAAIDRALTTARSRDFASQGISHLDVLIDIVGEMSREDS